jgi:hypothetical protein
VEWGLSFHVSDRAASFLIARIDLQHSVEIMPGIEPVMLPEEQSAEAAKDFQIVGLPALQTFKDFNCSRVAFLPTEYIGKADFGFYITGMVGEDTPVKLLRLLKIAFPALEPRHPIPRLEIMRVLADELPHEAQRVVQAMCLNINSHLAKGFLSIQFLRTRQG